MLRHESVGIDMERYISRFVDISKSSFDGIIEKFEQYEAGYVILNKLIKDEV